MLALRPELVDMGKAEGPEGIPGLHAKVHAEASVEYGRRGLAAITKKVTEVNMRLLGALRHPEESPFEVPCTLVCRGARAIAKLSEDEAGTTEGRTP
jgi:hypothetical protein